MQEHTLLQLSALKAEPEKPRPKLDGVGLTMKALRGEVVLREPPKERIVLDELGFRQRDPSKFPISRIAEVQQTLTLADHQDGIDLPAVTGPTDVRLVRRMIRQKMVRCKKCKNRFIEKNIYERHLRDKHPNLYEDYIREQEEEVELQRLEEIEANRIEELQTGGFIPPENEISQPSEDPNHIPLPGENTGGIVPKFDYFGRIKQLKRPYKKKVSPQCPFCDKRFRNEFSLKKHFLKKHEEMEEFRQCLKCFKCVENEKEMANHECELVGFFSDFENSRKNYKKLNFQIFRKKNNFFSVLKNFENFFFSMRICLWRINFPDFLFSI